jgi:hypothetical protein
MFNNTLLVHAVRFPGKGGILPTKALLREEAIGYRERMERTKPYIVHPFRILAVGD